MKTTGRIIICASLILLGCAKRNLDEKTAAELIIKEYQYPRAVSYDVFCGDPAHAGKVIDAGLEEKGLVKVDLKRRIIDSDKPFIHFTESARPYLMQTPEEDKKHKIQKIKVAEENFAGITNILRTSSDELIIVEYNITRKLNAFAPLWPNLQNKKKSKAYFILSDKGWEITDAKNAEFVNFRAN
ncbi:MAG: hypothetical protein REI96_13145 [Flavobacterium nitrogenifigens]|uniref:hypothetical protein n=1 Tax=Flavobacterium nitrogenifigens TaxID=1617283 RepID=UPI002808A261|nr:hypothetical protein [Flavobacterium nitrogenifigens]MDQ8013390.1 hypothetical protein [Flavobacterium nitrogenifigens]